MVHSLKLVREVEDDDDGRESGRVILHPALAEVPLLEHEVCDDAQLLWWKWGELLRKRGQLNMETLGWIESLVVWTDERARIRAKKGSIRYAQAGIDSALKKLNRLYDDNAVSSGGPEAHRYASFGFARRARQRRHGQD